MKELIMVLNGAGAHDPGAGDAYLPIVQDNVLAGSYRICRLGKGDPHRWLWRFEALCPEDVHVEAPVATWTRPLMSGHAVSTLLHHL